MITPNLGIQIFRALFFVSSFSSPAPPSLKIRPVESPDAASSSVDVERFQPFADAVNGTLLQITNVNIPDRSTPAAEFEFVRLLRQIEPHDPMFPVADR
jgi:hypothetical protein